MDATPKHDNYDIVIIGGAIMGSSTAWWLTKLGYSGRVLVVEADPSYSMCSTAHTNSCMRQQFSNELNIRISQFAAEFVTNMPEFMEDSDAPDLKVQSYGYMYLADTPEFAETLRENYEVQKRCGVATKLLTPDQIKAEYPFYNVDDLVLGSINTVNEGYWEGHTVFDWWRKKARHAGVEYIHNSVTDITRDGNAVTSVTLASGETVGAGKVVNTSGPRAAVTSHMAGIDLPVEPRKRFTWVFTCATPLDQELPLTIDPSGVHVRQDGKESYLAGGHTDYDPAVAFDDFAMDQAFFEQEVWPVLAHRVPAFEAIKIQSEWAGHYAYNHFDHNAVLGPHPEVSNFYFLNGFSGHGLQQSPAMGRGLAEHLIHGAYQTLDLSPFGYDRIPAGIPFEEKAVI